MVLAITGAVVALKVSEPLARATLDDLVGAVTEFDALTRRYAREHDRAVRMVVDLGDGSIRRLDENGVELTGKMLQLPRSIDIARLWIGRTDSTAGTVSIRCSRRGLTPSYAMLLEDDDGRKRWLLIAGLTGTVEQFESDETVENIFEAIRGGSDAG